MSDNIFQRFLKPSTKGKLWQVFAVILLVLTLAAGLIAFGNYYNKGADFIAQKTNYFVQLPKTKFIPFRLGLDLSGGTQLIYKADTSQVPAGTEAAAAQGVRDVIERRVNAYGVSEPLVEVQKSAGEDYRIEVDLAGVKNIDDAIKMIGATPILEFKEQGTPATTAAEQEKITAANTAALNKAQEALGKLKSGANFAGVSSVYNKSAAASSSSWIDSSNSPELAAQLAALKVGGITGVVETSKGYTIAKLLGERVETNKITNQPDTEVKAAHLLICYSGSESCTSSTTEAQALAKIKALKKIATPQNFTQLVKQNSTEPGAAQTGGELGWFGQGAMVKPFNDTVFAQKVGTISYVVQTKFGYHLIYKEGQRNVEEYNVQTIFIPKTTAAATASGTQNWVATNLTGKNLKQASVQFDNTGRPEVSLQFDADGGKLFSEITGRNVGKPIAIFLDGQVISAPTVDTEIDGGSAVINGSFTVAQANILAERLNAGALPVPITLVSQETVGATLGKASVANSLQAALWGVLLVVLFMIFYYRLPGLVSVVALAIYSVLLLAIFKVWGVMLLVLLAFVIIFFQLTGGALAMALIGFVLLIVGCLMMPSLAQLPVTLTLPGLAGFILSIGMAVDANILIFERFKEELRSGKPVSKAIELGFNRAWLSIRDGHISTILTCLVLMFFSTSIVKGFAITLLFGVVMSLFSAITVTKNLLALIPEKWFNSSLMTGVKMKKPEEEVKQ